MVGLESIIMSSQLKAKIPGAQSMGSARKVPACNVVTRQTPQIASRNSQRTALKTQSREHNSQLPVPVVNKISKANRKTFTMTKPDSNVVSPSPDTYPTFRKGKGNCKVDKTLNPNSTTIIQPSSEAPLEPSMTDEQEPHGANHLQPLLAMPVEGESPPVNASSDGTAVKEGVLPHTGESTNPPGSGLPPSNPGDPWHLAYTELRAMGKRMTQLDKIERDVESLKIKMETISTKTEQLESTVQGHTKDINSMKSAINEVKSSIKKHDESLAQLWSYAEDIAAKTDQRVRDIKQAIQGNIDQISRFANIKKDITKEVDTLIRESSQIIKNEIKKEFNDQIRRNLQATKEDFNNTINRHAHDIAYKGLQDQAYFNRHNLVLLGVQEHEQDSAFTQASKLFRSNLNLSNLSIDVAYRMGKPPAQGSSYSRPIIVKFSKISSRNSVWKKRHEVPRGEQGDRNQSIRIQADLPKQLREDLQILYRVQRAAIKSAQYQTVEVKNYKLYLDGEDFSAWELEALPFPLRPSTLATQRSDNTLAFYSKHSPLSNHYPSPFEVRGRSYGNMEQYLAYKKAKLSGQKAFINKALLAQNPVEAKSILNALKADHPDEWKKDLSAIATEGLQAKFRQNASLGEYLRSTAPLTLGEASKNPQWGVGFTLEDEDVLDKSKWNKQGNLLGRLLMKVRNQMIHERQQQAAANLEKKQSNLSNSRVTADQPQGKTTHQPGAERSPSD